MFTKQRKIIKARGSFSHGYGSKKKHRGAGHKGGHGNAGSGKRGDAKKPSYWFDKKKAKGFSKKGFTQNDIVFNITKINDLTLKNNFEKEGEMLVIDLNNFGYTKLLSGGEPDNKYKVIVNNASKKAIEKIEAKGGKVELRN